MPKQNKSHISAKINFIAMIALFSFVFVPSVSAESIYYPNDPYFKDQWYLRQIHAPEAWAITRGSSDVLVAVIDGGIDITHPDLKENIWVNQGEMSNDGIDNDHNGYIDDVQGWNFVKQSGDVRPMSTTNQMDTPWAHGTMNASLIAGRGDNNFGIAGVAWRVKIMPVVVLDADGYGNTRNIAKAIDYAVTMGADIVNISVFGFEPDRYIDEAIIRANEKGVLIVAAVGNDYSEQGGLNLDWTPTVPACSEVTRDGVLGVTASDVLDQHATHANTGTKCVDLIAPGYDLVTAHPQKPIPFPGDKEEAGIHDVVFHISGTSVAAPLVSGAAALIKSLRPRWTNKQIFAQLLATSDAIGGTKQMDDPAPLGYGRLNIGRAILELPPEEEPLPVPTRPRSALEQMARSSIMPFTILSELFFK